jgi:NitT/TauT family transport system permease protein
VNIAGKRVAPLATTRTGELRAALRPNRSVGARTSGVLIAAWAAAALAAWAASPVSTLPAPREVIAALDELWWRGGLGPELFTTLKLIGSALGCSLVLSLVLAWGSVIPAVRPITAGMSKLRFLGLTGLLFPFTLATGGGFALKVALLTFGMTTFLVTALARVVAEIPRSQIDYVRSLGASDSRVIWETVVRGTLDRTIDAVRQNVAMGWSMITMVEGIARSDGGVGALLLNQNKHFRLAEVHAVLAVILLVGLVIDYGMGALAGLVCPHTRFDSTAKAEGSSS